MTGDWVIVYKDNHPVRPLGKPLYYQKTVPGSDRYYGTEDPHKAMRFATKTGADTHRRQYLQSRFYAVAKLSPRKEPSEAQRRAALTAALATTPSRRQPKQEPSDREKIKRLEEENSILKWRLSRLGASDQTTCSVEGCERKHKARGYCLRHYKQWARTGEVWA